MTAYANDRRIVNKGGKQMSKVKLTPVQLQQKIIHLQSELGKYKKRVKDYQENYHYRLLDELREENMSLVEKNQLLQTSYKEIYEKNQQLEQENKQHQENLIALEDKNEKLVNELKEEIKSLKDSTTVFKPERDEGTLSRANKDGTDWFTRNLQNQVKSNKK